MENKMVICARYSDTYYFGIRPLISSRVAEMDDMSVVYPTQEMHENIVNRVYDDVTRMYPDEFEEQSFNVSGQSADEQLFRPRRRRLLRDLLGTLILFELLDRRRHRRY